MPFDELPTALAAVDIVIASTGAPDPVIRRETVSRVIPTRRGRPLFFIDIAVPRDVEDTVDTLDGVYCYDIDDLKQVVDAKLSGSAPARRIGPRRSSSARSRSSSSGLVTSR